MSDAPLTPDEVVLAVGDIVLDVNETPLPLPNPPRDWSALPVPLSAQQLEEMGRIARVLRKGNPRMATYERRVRILSDIVLKLIEHNDCFDEVEP